jgi:osmotically-inducible protein OsmY
MEAPMPRTFLDDGRIEFRPREQQGYGLDVRRSDQRIRQRLREGLARTGIDLSQVAVTVADGVVRLAGSVPATRTKQAIEHAAAGCAGVRQVDNRIRVWRAASDRSGSKRDAHGKV